MKYPNMIGEVAESERTRFLIVVRFIEANKAGFFLGWGILGLAKPLFGP